MAANTEAATARIEPSSPSLTVSVADPASQITVSHTPANGDVEQLVAQAKAGDRQAFAALYRQYLPQVYKFLYYRVGDRTKTEDMTAEVFLRALRKIGDFTWTGADFGAWLLRIARNLILDDAKSSRSRLETVADEMPEDACGEAETAETVVMGHLTNEEVYDAIKKLRPDQREVIALRFLQGLNVSEVAEIMGKKEGTIRTLQFRGLKALEKILAGRGLADERAGSSRARAGGVRMGTNGRGKGRTEPEAARYGVAEGDR